MIPGMGRMNPRMMKKLQKQIEKATEEIDATKVIIETPEKTLVFDHPSVTIMDMMGQKTYQVVGEPSEIENEEDGIPEEDVELVVAQTGVSKEEAESVCEGNSISGGESKGGGGGGESEPESTCGRASGY